MFINLSLHCIYRSFLVLPLHYRIASMATQFHLSHMSSGRYLMKVESEYFQVQAPCTVGRAFRWVSYFHRGASRILWSHIDIITVHRSEAYLLMSNVLDQPSLKRELRCRVDEIFSYLTFDGILSTYITVRTWKHRFIFIKYSVVLNCRK